VRRLSDYRLQVHLILLVRRALLHSAPSSRCRLPALRAAALLSPSSCRAYARSGACADLLWSSSTAPKRRKPPPRDIAQKRAVGSRPASSSSAV